MNTPQRSWSGTAADFVRQSLQANPDMDYAAIKSEASAHGLSVPPIVYGRIRKEMPSPARAAAAAAAARAPAEAAPAARKPSKSPALDYAMRELRQRPDATFRELKEYCDAQGWRLPPILYGRAKALLGLVPMKPRTSKKQKAAAAAAAATESKPPMRLRQVESVDAATFARKLDDIRSLDQLVATVREIDAERRRLRDLLERIVDMIDTALD